MRILLFVLSLILLTILFTKPQFYGIELDNKFKKAIYLALCSDGEYAEQGSSFIINLFNEVPVYTVVMLKQVKSDKLQDCSSNYGYLEPTYYNALLSLIMSEYGTDHISELHKNDLIEFNQTNTDPDLDYFIKQLIKI